LHEHRMPVLGARLPARADTERAVNLSENDGHNVRPNCPVPPDRPAACCCDARRGRTILGLCVEEG
jgi:hypothetical protein